MDQESQFLGCRSRYEMPPDPELRTPNDILKRLQEIGVFVDADVKDALQAARQDHVSKKCAVSVGSLADIASIEGRFSFDQVLTAVAATGYCTPVIPLRFRAQYLDQRFNGLTVYVAMMPFEARDGSLNILKFQSYEDGEGDTRTEVNLMEVGRETMFNASDYFMVLD